MFKFCSWSKQSSTVAGLKSWRCFKTVFGESTATKGHGRKLEDDDDEEEAETEEEHRDEGEEMAEEDQQKAEEEEEEDEGDEGRNDEALGEDVSLLANIPVDRRRIARRYNTRLFLFREDHIIVILFQQGSHNKLST